MSSRLVLQAADKGEPPLSATATVRVQVVDVNDNSPTIPHMEPVVIAESRSEPVYVPHAGPAAPGSPELFCPTADRPAGHMVAQVTANDVDLSSTITYSLPANSSASCPFAIDRYSGVLSLTRALDHEEQAEYRLTVLASDSLHQTSGEVRVQLLDLNDNAPVFSQDCYQVRVPCPSRDGRMDRWMDACDFFCCFLGGRVRVGSCRHAGCDCLSHRQRLWCQRGDQLQAAVVPAARLLRPGGQR